MAFFLLDLDIKIIILQYQHFSNIMKRLNSLIFLLSILTTPAIAGEQVSILDFGAKPNDGVNDIEAFRKATDFCRSNPGTTLIIPPGVYDIEDPLALKLEREAIGGAYGENVQGTLFRHDAPYVKAFDLSDCKNVKVDAPGASLLLHGWYEIITLDNADDVEVNGLSIRYKRHPNTVGKVIESTPEYFDLWFDNSKYNYIDSVVTGRTHFFDPVRNRLYTGWGSKKILTSPNTIRIYSGRKPAVGDYCILRHGGHYRPAVMIREAKDISLKNMKIHSQPGMGIVGHRSKDISLENVQIVPEPGDVISTNTDATHFTSCSGTIKIENCIFKGQGDDCTNIHNYYARIYPLSSRKAELRIENADLHALSLDPPEVGDSMIIIDRRNMATIEKVMVKNVENSEKDWRTVVTFDKPIKNIDPDNHVITNLTRFPKVVIKGNSVDSHLARAFLVKSPDVTISGNRITGSTGTAIKLGAELGWNESGPVDNVLIEDNYISDCGYDGNNDVPACITLSTEASETPTFVNRNIIIRNNILDSPKSVLILLKDGENITVKDNLVPQSFSTDGNKHSYIKIENCRSVNLD